MELAELALGAGWLHTKINVRHRELNPEMVTYLSTDRARISGKLR